MRRRLARLGRFLLRLLAADAGLAGLGAALGWGLGWRTWPAYSWLLMGLGLFILFLASPAFLSSGSLLGSPTFWYLESLMPGTREQHLRHMLGETDTAPAGLPLLAAIGLTLIALGLWVGSLA